jgi:glycosyltransferase involved in cell wall biosynthesis
VRTPSPDSSPQPLLSVVTGAYNAADYLPRCIESVLSQTMRSLELHVVDEGSTDATSQIVARYAAGDSRIRGFRGPNRGVSHARNVALRHARGQYLAFLDSDDEWDPLFAERLTAILDRRPDIAVVTGNAFNLGGPADGKPVRPWPAEASEITFLDMLEREDSVFIMSVFRREVYETIGGLNEALFRSEDYEFWLRAAATGFRFVSCPEPLGRYRRRPDSASANQSAMLETILTVLRSARGFRKRARADELAAIDRQVERFTSEWILSKGKAALLRRDFTEARGNFRELYRRGAGLQFALVAAGLAVAPTAVLKAYQARMARRGHALSGARLGTAAAANVLDPGTEST